MALDRLNPAGLRREPRHTHAVVATGTQMVFVSGQVALDAAGRLVGEGDVIAQARQAFKNVATAVEAAGGSVADVAKITWYVVSYSDDLFRPLMDARTEVFGDHAPAGTLVGVEALGAPEFLTEVEAIAVLDRSEKTPTPVVD
jgi:enamine deaminase RidA (YjgF/YER057c/UK114 family)